MKLRPLIPRFLFVLLVLLGPSVRAQDGLAGAFSCWNHTTGFIRTPFATKLIAADFDKDNRPDGAVLLDAGQVDGQKTFRIELHLTTGRNSQLTFASNEPELAISALDVNQDGAPDIVVEQLFTHKRLHIWLNDGQGRFRKAQLNEFPGNNDEKSGQFEFHCPVEALPTLYLPSKTGFEHAVPRDASRSPDSVPSAGHLHSVILAALSISDAPNPSRGPPSFICV
jgi:hypothetical protein